MTSTRRRTIVGVVVAAAAASLLASATPAQAIVIPDWPAAGHVPVGCSGLNVLPAGTPGGYAYQYTDTGAPRVLTAGLSTGGGTPSRVIVIGTTGRNLSWVATTSETCTGISGLALYFRLNGAPVNAVTGLAPTTTDVFNTRWTTTPLPASPDDAGTVVLPFAATARRYDTVILLDDYTLSSKTDTASGATWVQGPWASTTTYLLRQTTLTSAVSRTAVRKGGAVVVSGVLKYATPGHWAVDNGEKVLVQVKVGSGAWKTRATLVAGSTGKVSYTFKPTKTSKVRLVHAAHLAVRFTAAVNSTIRGVKVT